MTPLQAANELRLREGRHGFVTWDRLLDLACARYWKNRSPQSVLRTTVSARR